MNKEMENALVITLSGVIDRDVQRDINKAENAVDLLMELAPYCYKTPLQVRVEEGLGKRGVEVPESPRVADMRMRLSCARSVWDNTQKLFQALGITVVGGLPVPITEECTLEEVVDASVDLMASATEVLSSFGVADKEAIRERHD
jgi:hypothetical protein